MSENPSACNCPSGSCGPNRREFLALMGVGATAALVSGIPAMAGPFERADFDKLVPADKKLSAEWLKSLTDPGAPAVYRGADLTFIGMPVGGLCTGQLYLGGDGKLWHWDIFNKHMGTGDAHYSKPPLPDLPLDQGFALRVTAGGKSVTRALDASGFADIAFRGEYPIGYVEYRDPAVPVTVSLEAFSPFVPLNASDSGLPATIFQFTVKNTGGAKAEVELAGWLENAVCLNTAQPGQGVRRNRLSPGVDWTYLDCTAAEVPEAQRPKKRPDILFDDFEKETYEGWTATGTAFGSGPIEKTKIPEYQGDVGGTGKRVVNSHASAPGNSVGERDGATGTLTSKTFTIERDYISFLIGGGGHKDKTCINLLVDDKVVLSATGKNDNKMQPHSFDVRRWAGKTARLRIVDIVFADVPAGPPMPFNEREDFGTMALAVLERDGREGASSIPDGKRPEGVFAEKGLASDAAVEKPFGQKLCGAVGRHFTLEPGKEMATTFVVAWSFPNQRLGPVPGSTGQHYATRFKTAGDAVLYVAKNLAALAGQTRLWHDTWYDSTLPRWFLDRTFLNTSILATSTSHRFADGRFYGWEGVGCCAGTCTHVWHYAHAPARIFPELERDLRERTDFGLAFNPDTGVIKFRAEGAGLAIDGQCGCILRAYREHQMSADGAFLGRNWPKIRKALECLIAHDENGDGLIEGAQHNTLDADWFGPVAWLSGLFLAALRAGEEMARETGDAAFAETAHALWEKGRKTIVEQLWGGEYFINKPDPKHLDAINSGTGCEIDQVFGQSWAYQVHLGRVLDEEHTKQALRALWRYNFTPDVGPYRQAYKPGRWYAMPGEAGLLMCTFPRQDWDFENAKGNNKNAGFAGYFNECMNGFEYQVAGHMIWEGMVREGLAVTRAVHDRYHASRRNPWNEVECGDHYARSMASYGVFLAACGYEYHGPKGYLAFAPRLAPEAFRAAFTTAEGWGTFCQQTSGARQQEKIEVKSGKLRLRTLAFAIREEAQPKSVRVTVGDRPVDSKFAAEKGRVTITLGSDTTLDAGQAIEVVIE
jgi:uncharacterized protein (DUF608 family)